MSSKIFLSIASLAGVLILMLQGLTLYGTRSLSRSSLQQTSLLLAQYQAEKVRTSLAYAETASEAVLRTAEVSQLLHDPERLKGFMSEILTGNPQISVLEIHQKASKPIVLRRTSNGKFVEAPPEYDTGLLTRRPLQEQRDGDWVFRGNSHKLARAFHAQSRNGVILFIEIPYHLLVDPLENQEGQAYGFLATDSQVVFDARVAGLEPDAEWNDFTAEVILGPSSGEAFYAKSDPVRHQGAWVGIARVGDLPLKVGVVHLESKLFDLERGLVAWSIALSIAGLLLALLTTLLLSRSIVLPLERLVTQINKAAESGFKGQVEAGSGATFEVKALSKSFNKLLDDIQTHLKKLEREATQRQALESELGIASRIQSSLLPNLPFLSPTLKADGLSIPAKEVGGDFMSVFSIDERRVGFFLGDVSGKGVPAAIYMAFAASLFEHLGRLDVSPKEIFGIVNEALCARNEPTMFATVFFGLLNDCGRVDYCNGGHHPPLLLKEDGTVHEIQVESGLGVGILESFDFTNGSFQLEQGEGLFLYTDGLTEAMNDVREEFSEQRLLSFLEKRKDFESLNGLVVDLTVEVDLFRNGAEPNDDFTVFALRYLGREAAHASPES